MTRHTLVLSFIAALSTAFSAWADDSIVSPPEKWEYTSAYTQTLPSDDAWWRTFHDPVLDTLISIGIDNNYNVSTAVHRIEVARQEMRAARSGYYPQFGLSAGWQRARSSGNITSPGTPASTVDYFSLGVDMAWQVDVFGRVNSQLKQKKAQYQASRADYAAVMVTLCSDIANAYIQLRMLQIELAVTNEHVQSQGRVLKIAEARHEAGLASKLDVAQASIIYNSTCSTLPGLEASIDCVTNNINLLLGGNMPAGVRKMLQGPTLLPEWRQIVSIGVPMDLLRRRPDIAEAEYNMAAAAAAVGIAKKDFLPTLTLEGSVGYQAHNIDKMFNGRSFVYSVAPKISWTIFDGFQRSASVASAREQMQIAMDQYNYAVETAVNEANNAIINYTQQVKTIAQLEVVTQNAHDAFDLSIDLYKQGLSDFTNVANAQIDLLTYSNQLVSARAQAATDLVTLYQALGGGWSQAY